MGADAFLDDSNDYLWSIWAYLSLPLNAIHSIVLLSNIDDSTIGKLPMTFLTMIKRHSPLIRLASLQFVSLATIGMVVPYINIYLIDANFSATLIGTLSSIGAILALSITPLLNHYADKNMLHRRLFMCYMLLVSVASIIFANFTVKILLITAALLFPVAIGPSITLGLQLTMTQIADRTNNILGQIRSFGALGFAVASLMAGQLFGWGGYSLLFWVSAILGFISIQVSTIFPAHSKQKQKEVPKITNFSKGFYVLLFSQFFIAMGLRNSFAFTFIHLADNLGVATSDIGLWAFFIAGIEVPFFILTDRFLPKVQSRLAFITGAVGMTVFIFLLGITQNWMLLLLLILFRGVMFPIFQLSSFIIVAEISHKNRVATNQAILHVTIPNIAILFTGSAFGWLYEHTGAFTFFAVCALACFIGVVIIALYRGEMGHTTPIEDSIS